MKINIHLGNSETAMQSMPANKYGLALVDPEYGIGADKKNSSLKKQSRKSSAYSKDYGQKEWDSETATLDYFKQLFRISKEQIIWGVNYYPYDLFAGGRIYWNKCVTMPTYSDGELAYCSLINSLKSYTFAWHGMIQGDMKNKQIRIHPTEKPVALYKWQLMKFGFNKDGSKRTIFDSHAGSMSLVIACIDLGFDIDIWEIDEDYYTDAVNRVKRHLAQQDLTREIVDINYYSK